MPASGGTGSRQPDRLESMLPWRQSCQGPVADPLREPTTRSGRRFAKPADGDELVLVSVCEPGATVALASEKGRAILFDSEEVPVLAGPGSLAFAGGRRRVASLCRPPRR